MFIVVILRFRRLVGTEGSRPMRVKHGILHIGLTASIQDDSYSNIFKILFLFPTLDLFRHIAGNFFIMVEFHRIVRASLGH